MKRIRVLNMTKLFKKEILLYSVFDIRFKTPFKLMKGIYFILVTLIFSVPFVYLTWPLNPYTFFISVVVPWGASNFMSQPIFHGRTFFSALRVYIKYLFEDKIFYHNKSSKKLKEYELNHITLISRRDDYKKLEES